MSSISRWLTSALEKGLSFQRAALLVGARQSGKTTLVREQCPVSAQYVTMDNEASLLAAREDPHFFLNQYAGSCLVIDEIQKAPSLISEVKRHVDENNRPRQFILTGSTDYRKLPTAENADSLTGRVVVLRLRTLSRAEKLGALPLFLENAFGQRFPKDSEIEPCSRRSIYSWAIEGGYPQTIGFTSENRNLYFKSYIQSQILYDLTKMWDLRRYKDLGDLLQIFAAYSSKPLNVQEICRKLNGNAQTITSYLIALQSMFLVDCLPAWESKDYRIGSKTPKIFISDSALMANLLGIYSPENLLSSQEKMANEGGKLVETWAYSQIMSEAELHALWSVHHFRNKNNQEVDFLIQDEANRYLGIEIKAAESINSDDFRHLRWFSQQVPNFVGVVLYAGCDLLSLGKGLYAVPFSALWAWH